MIILNNYVFFINISIIYNIFFIFELIVMICDNVLYFFLFVSVSLRVVVKEFIVFLKRFIVVKFDFSL